MENFLSNHQLYVVMFIVLFVWAGIILYLLRVDRKLKQLEKLMKKG